MPILDSLIAAICISKSLTLVTRNEKDFKACDIQVVNPWATYRADQAESDPGKQRPK